MTALSISRLKTKLVPLYEAPIRASRTRSKIERQLDLITQAKIMSTSGLTTSNLARYVQMRRAEGICPNTIRGELDYIKTIVNICTEEGWLEKAPSWKRFRPRKRKAKLPKLHPVEDVARLLDHLRRGAGTWSGARLLALAAVVAYTGLRRDEALYLKVEDIDLKRRLIDVVARAVDRDTYKTEESEALIPIAPPLVPILRSWLKRCQSEWVFPGVRLRGPWVGGASGERACDRLRQSAEEVGIQGMTLLSLRHTFATWARRKWGLSALELQEILRHTSPATQAHYLHPDPNRSDMVRSVRRVNYGAARTGRRSAKAKK